MRYNVLTPQAQLAIAEDRLLGVEADHYQQDLENRLAVAMSLDNVRDATGLKRDAFGVAISVIEAEIDRLKALIPDETP